MRRRGRLDVRAPRGFVYGSGGGGGSARGSCAGDAALACAGESGRGEPRRPSRGRAARSAFGKTSASGRRRAATRRRRRKAAPLAGRHDLPRGLSALAATETERLHCRPTSTPSVKVSPMITAAAVRAQSTGTCRGCRPRPLAGLIGTAPGAHHMLSGADTPEHAQAVADDLAHGGRQPEPRQRQGAVLGDHAVGLVVRVVQARELGQVVGDAVGLAGARGRRHDPRVLEQPLDQALLLRKPQRAEVDLVPRRQRIRCSVAVRKRLETRACAYCT